MEDSNSSEVDRALADWVVPKPAASLLELPYDCRWEVTRRHPYYLRFWQAASRHQRRSSHDPQEIALGKVACFLLQLIGVTGEPPPPSARAESLQEGSLGQAWQSGAVAPLTLRSHLEVVVAGLPREVWQQVATLLLRWSCDAPAAPTDLYDLLERLREFKHPALDSVPDAPLLGLNLAAPQRLILREVEAHVRHGKQQKGLPETRRRDDKLATYLEAWDLREGWDVDHYDGSKELTLREAAVRLGVPLATVSTHYRAAFRLIVGHSYAPELWLRLIGVHKFLTAVGPSQLPRRLLQRPFQSRRAAVVPEPLLEAAQSGACGTTLLGEVGVCLNDVLVTDLLDGLCQLLADGKTNDEIIAELDLQYPQSEAMIQLFRERLQDNLGPAA